MKFTLKTDVKLAPGERLLYLRYGDVEVPILLDINDSENLEWWLDSAHAAGAPTRGYSYEFDLHGLFDEDTVEEPEAGDAFYQFMSAIVRGELPMSDKRVTDE